MTDQSVFKATFSNIKNIPSRKVCQLVFEVPIEAADAALYALGGLPNPAAERWVAVARLNDEPPSAEPVAALPAPDIKRWADLPPAQQAAIRCGEPEFCRFLHEGVSQTPGFSLPGVPGPDAAAAFVRAICGVASRAEFNTNDEARTRWNALEAEFWAWSRGYRA